MMLFLFSLIFFLCTCSGAWAQERRHAITTTTVAAAFPETTLTTLFDWCTELKDEGVQLLQGKARKAGAHSKVAIDAQAQSQAFGSLYGKEGASLKERLADAVQVIARRKEKRHEVLDVLQNASSTNASAELRDSEGLLLEDSDMRRVRFRALHRDWIDILDLYSDGFFSRYHDRDVGVWHMDRNHLVLKWLKWGEERLQSADGGLTFSTTNSVPFRLKSFFQPIWWSNHFKSIGTESLHLAQERNVTSNNDEKIAAVNVPAIIARHVNGRTADLNEKGYQIIASLKDDMQMEIFMRRVAHSMGLRVRDEGGLRGAVPYYSGMKSVQSYKNMAAEFDRTAHEGKFGWIADPKTS